MVWPDTTSPATPWAERLDCTVHDRALHLRMREMFRETGRVFQTDFDGCLVRNDAEPLRRLL